MPASLFRGETASWLLVAAMSVCGPAAVAQAEPPGPDPQRRALLVGVSHYPNLPAKYQLAGAQRDVELLARVLREKLGFPPAQIVELSEAAGAKRAEQLPSRANIDKAVEGLINDCRRGDQVLLFFAGHGVQQPAAAGPQRKELDGLDEVFLPRDAAGWDEAQGKIPSGLADDQIELWVEALAAKGASVWLIVDSCHSGTMLRGPGETVRQVPAEALGIPRERLAAARSQAAADRPKTRGGGFAEEPALALGTKPGVVAFYACHPQEVTVEQRLPRDSKDSRPHGLFCYTLCETLSTALEGTRPLTYRELLGRVRRRYTELGRDTPSPMAEGTALDVALLGQESWPGRASIRTLAADRINAGALRGLTIDSVLAVFADEASPKPLGHVRVVEPRMLDADVISCEYDGLPEPAAIPIGALCRPVYLDRGEQQLAVAIDAVDAAGQPVPAAARAKLAALLAGGLPAGNVPSLLKPVEQIDQADWLLRLAGEGVVLVPASKSQGPAPAEKNPAFGPFAPGPKLAAQVRESLERIARAGNLTKLASGGAEAVLGGEKLLRVETSLARLAADKPLPVDWQAATPRFHNQDVLRLEIRNPNDVPIDVTALFVDSQYGITALFPQGEDNRLPPGRTLPLELEVRADTTGHEHLIVIATRGDDEERIDLTILEQPSLALAQSTKGLRGSRSLKSPLGDLLSTSLYRQGRTRGSSAQGLQSYALQSIGWKTLAEARPREE